MAEPLAPLPADLYERDETAWLEQTSRLVGERQWQALDAVHLSEYLSDMAKRDRREVLSRLTVLMAHLLKWDSQPECRTGGWRATILEQRAELADLLESATLRRHAEESLDKAYERACRQAAAETELALDAFPSPRPYSLEQLLATD